MDKVADSHRELLTHRWDCPRWVGGPIGTLGRWARMGGPSTAERRRAREQWSEARALDSLLVVPVCHFHPTTTLRLPGPGRRLPRTFQNATTDLQVRILHASASY